MKQTFTLFIAALLATHVFGQAPLTADDITSTIGTQFIYYNTLSADPGDPGTDQTWDFSNMVVQGQQNVEIQDMESTGVEFNFPDANCQWVYNFGVTSIFMAFQPDSLSYYGQYEEGGNQLIYSNPITFIPFPASVDTPVQDNYVFDYVTTGGTGHVVGDYSGSVDGVGTLIMPWGEVQNAYRVFATDNHTENFVSNTVPYTASYSGTSSMWFAAGYPGPLLTITSGTLSVPALNLTQDQNSTTYLGNFTFVGINQVKIVKDLKVWPIPAKDELNISFENQSADDIQLTLFDISGKQLQYRISKPSSGIGYSTKLDVSGLSPGYYLLRLRSEKGVQAVKVSVH